MNQKEQISQMLEKLKSEKPKEFEEVMGKFQKKKPKRKQKSIAIKRAEEIFEEGCQILKNEIAKKEQSLRFPPKEPESNPRKFTLFRGKSEKVAKKRVGEMKMKNELLELKQLEELYLHARKALKEGNVEPACRILGYYDTDRVFECGYDHNKERYDELRSIRLGLERYRRIIQGKG